jgi:hypothetical protein
MCSLSGVMTLIPACWAKAAREIIVSAAINGAQKTFIMDTLEDIPFFRNQNERSKTSFSRRGDNVVPRALARSQNMD